MLILSCYTCTGLIHLFISEGPCELLNIGHITKDEILIETLLFHEMSLLIQKYDRPDISTSDICLIGGVCTTSFLMI